MFGRDACRDYGWIGSLSVSIKSRNGEWMGFFELLVRPSAVLECTGIQPTLVSSPRVYLPEARVFRSEALFHTYFPV